jgi:putative transposase
VSVAAFIASQRTEHDVPHAVACRALGVSESWFYKWRDRPPTPRQQRRSTLAAAIRQVFNDSGGTYGSPRIGDELRDQGWHVSDTTIAQLMAELGLVAALNRAAVTRGGDVAGVIFHSDRGSEYTSADFAGACARWKVRQSMGRVGSCFDNAVAEATFSTIKVEYVHRRQLHTRNEARLKIATWITDFYNRRRRHSACDGLSPVDYERSTIRVLENQAA